jgi:hypothetical protein
VREKTFRKILLQQEVVSLGHVLFPFLAAAALPMAIMQSKNIFPFFSEMNADTIGIHTFILHILGWYRGASNPTARHNLSKKVANWTLLISIVSVIHLGFFVVRGQVDLTVILDLVLMANSYFNGIIASGILLAASSFPD